VNDSVDNVVLEYVTAPDAPTLSVLVPDAAAANVTLFTAPDVVEPTNVIAAPAESSVANVVVTDPDAVTLVTPMRLAPDWYLSTWLDSCTVPPPLTVTAPDNALSALRDIEFINENVVRVPELA
jgi:hypothetical protein